MRAKADSTGLLSCAVKMSSNKVRRFLRMMRGYVGWISLLTLTAALVITRACTSGKCLHHGSRVFYRTNQTPIWSDAEVFIGGDTVAEVHRDGEKLACRLTVINDDGDREEMAKTFPNASWISLAEMMPLIEKCGEAEEFFKERSWSAKKLVMYPGTLWCGPGDYASNYSHLGEAKEIDKCCRSHDFCPIKIYAGKTRFGLKPPFMRAALLCECERAFDRCLRKVEAASDDPSNIRHYYFDFLNPPCLNYSTEGNYSLIPFETYNATKTTTPAGGAVEAVLKAVRK